MSRLRVYGRIARVLVVVGLGLSMAILGALALLIILAVSWRAWRRR